MSIQKRTKVYKGNKFKFYSANAKAIIAFEYLRLKFMN